MIDLGKLQHVMARLDRAIQQARVHAPNESYDRLDGPLLRAMTV